MDSNPAPSRLTSRHALWMTVGSIAADRLVTVLWWGHEANPLVSGMGMWAWLGLTAVLIVLIYHTVRLCRDDYPVVAHGLLGLITGLHLVAVVSNLLTVAGYL